MSSYILLDPIPEGERVVSAKKSIQTKRPDYIQHLEGIRALALGGVLLFHFDVPCVQGGYLGVDVFLVLSGYLMTRNILLKIEAGNFSLREFYVSRFWRLYPSALATTKATLLLAFALFPPDLARRTIESALASMLALSNMYFYTQENYFDVSSVRKPLLHMWSLSMEEQYYMFYPGLLVVLSFVSQRVPLLHRSGLIVLLTALCAVSLAMSIYLNEKDQSLGFFGLPSRLFEFGVGSLAFLTENIVSVSNVMQHLLATAGLAIIFGSYYSLPSQSPVLFSLPSVIGTAILISTPKSFWAKHILSSFVGRRLGLLSYSAYLVHWPLFVFSKWIAEASQINILVHPLFLTTGSLCIATVLRHTIESQYRRRPYRSKTMTVGIALTAGLVWSGLKSGGWSNRSNVATQEQGRHALRDLCVDIRPNAWSHRRSYTSATSGCLVGAEKEMLAKFVDAKKAGMPSVSALVVGNSFTRHLTGAFDELAVERKKQKLKKPPFVLKWLGGCDILPKENKEKNGDYPELCHEHNVEAWKLIASMPRNTTVMVANDWANGGKEDRALNNAVQVAADIKKMGHYAVIIGSPASVGKEHHCLTCVDIMKYAPRPIYWLLRKGNGCRGEYTPWPDVADAHFSLLRYAARKDAVYKYVDTMRRTCTESGDRLDCNILIGLHKSKSAFERDGKHLSVAGSRNLMPCFQDFLD